MTTEAETKRVRKKCKECSVPSTTRLKLFRYPHKFGGESWCVGFELHNHSERGDFVSQTFITEWSDSYEHHHRIYNRWKQILGIRES